MRTILYKVILTLIIISILLGTTGCWDNVTLIEKAIVLGIGLDKIDDDTIEVTLQIINPVSLSSQGNSSGSTNTNNVWVHSTQGDTLFDTIRKQLQTVNRKPYYSHLQLIVIGEELARSGIGEFLDFFERDQELRLAPNVVIAKDTTAKKILSAKSDLENIPAMHLMEILLNDKSDFHIYNVRLFDIITSLNFPKKNPTIGKIEIKEEVSELKIANIDVKGAGIFLEDKLIGWIDDDSVEGLNYILGKVQNGLIIVKDPLNEEELVTIEQKRSDTKIGLNIEGDQFKYSINIKAQGTIGGQQGEDDLTNQKNSKMLEKKVEDSINKKVQNIVDLAQNEYKSDIFGFGEKLYKEYPDYWKNVESNWEDEFSNALVEINVDFKIINSGLIDSANEIE
ncbi:Ger(x)C family spore germination protein [Clostridium sp. D2Q-14]|uniref:Ger(x)C family spore germination protein n=1 Tax=Anaeromonas gelatinilytica TaxID=2683194 RepID=UPI00193B8C3A|nr:Ger(x)C family spore germination protein [Anaeromonas gelatinilytica]MBS4534758.1 Ger(x)C family spore germination protein [Anaeromonas gelatinilytica]